VRDAEALRHPADSAGSFASRGWSPRRKNWLVLASGGPSGYVWTGGSDAP